MMDDEKEAVVRRASAALYGSEWDTWAHLHHARYALDASGVWERIEELECERDEARVEVERLREALRWVDNCEQGCDVCRVHARAALASSPSETEENAE